jgi:hypothetical protein
MVDERGRKMQMVEEGQKNKMRDNYRFILPVRASHFRSVGKTISIPKYLGHRCDWRTCRSGHGILVIVAMARPSPYQSFHKSSREVTSHVW